MKKISIAAFYICCWSVAANAQKLLQLSIKDAVQQAYNNLPGLKNLQLDYEIQKNVNKEIEGSALPQVTASGGLSNYLSLPQFLFPDGTATAIYSILKEEGVKDGSGNPITKEVALTSRQVSFQQPWNSTAGITLNQLLFQPDVFIGLKARALALEYSRQNIEVEKEKVKEQAYKQYYAVLIAEKQLDFIGEGITRLEKLKHDMEQLYKNGFREKLDIDKVEVPLNNLKSTKNLLENAIQLNYSSLKFSLGASQKDSIVLTDKLSPETVKSDLPSDADFDFSSRKEIQLLGSVKKLQNLDVQRQKLSNLPTLAAFINYQVQGQGKNFITSKNTLWVRTSLVGLQLNVPVFNGFARKYKIKEAELKLQKVDNNFDQLKKAIEFEQYISKSAFKNAILNLDIQQRNMDLAKNIYNTTKKKYEQGLASSFEVLNDQNAITDTESKYFDALFQAQIAKISFLKALGKLD
jgi:outer membrane protein TolC